MLSCKITIPFTPAPKASVRLGKTGAYNPSNKGMNRARIYVSRALKDYKQPLMKGAVLVVVHFRLPVALCQKPWKRRKQHLLPYARRPDADNLEKFLNDALSGVVWDDDCNIVWILRSKSYTCEKEGETILYVRQLENTKPNYPLIIADILANIEIEEGTTYEVANEIPDDLLTDEDAGADD